MEEEETVKFLARTRVGRGHAWIRTRDYSPQVPAASRGRQRQVFPLRPNVPPGNLHQCPGGDLPASNNLHAPGANEAERI